MKKHHILLFIQKKSLILQATHFIPKVYVWFGIVKWYSTLLYCLPQIMGNLEVGMCYAIGT